MGLFPIQLILFLFVFVLFCAMYACVGRLARLLRERHADRLEELGLADLRDWGNRPGSELTVPRSVLRFLWRRRFYRLRDDEIVRLSHAMRWLFFAFATGFAVLFCNVMYLGLKAQFGPRERIGDAAPAVTSREDRRDLAYELHRNGRHAEAIAIYDELQARGSTDGEMLFHSGNAKSMLGQEDAALADYRRVMDLDPGRFAAYLSADRILSRQKRFDDCIDLWTRYLRVVPRDAEAYYERGGSYFHKGELAASLADVRRACELGKAAACRRVEDLEKRMQ